MRRIGHLLREGIWVYLQPYWRLHGALAVAIVLTVGFETCFPLTVRFLIDEALIPQHANNLVSAVVIFVVLFALAAASRFVVAVIRAYMNAELNKDFRIIIFQLMQRLPMSYYDRAQPAQFSPLFDTELVTFSRMLRDLFSRGFHAILQLLVVMITMFFLNWQLAVVVLALLPLLVMRPQRRLLATVDALDRIRKTIERVNGSVQDAVASQALVHAFGLRVAALKRFNAEVVGREGDRIRLSRFADIKRTLTIPHFLMQAYRLSMQNQQAAMTLMVICVGAGLTFIGALTLGTFSAFILFLPVVMNAVTEISEYVEDLGRATLSLERIERVRDAGVDDVDAESAVSLPAPTQGICFEQVAFGYSDDNQQIRDLNLTLPIGQSMALVGRSGAGKSTILKLLLGFYRPTSGRILIDGHDLTQITPSSRGECMGPVLQQTILTNTTIRKNICFARPEATDEEVENAAKMAEIHDYIVGLPKGYDSEVGEGGRWLSEGQRQRIALARAILVDPSILVLDEVTAALDPESETAIIATIKRLAQQRTVILVTHRLSCAAFADQLVVIDQGQVKEQGSHEQLLARDGLYHQFWEMQTGFVVSADGLHAEVHGERLKAIPLFQGVEVEKLDALAASFISEFHPPGQVVYEQGESGDKFYIVVRGTVSVSTLGAGEQSIRLADLQDGDYFGEVEMLSRGRRTTTVTARTPCLLLTLHAEHFHSMMEELSSLNKIMTQMALGRSLSTLCSTGRRRRSDPVWEALMSGS